MKNINKEEILSLGNKLLRCPELGYKEFKTKEILVDYLKKLVEYDPSQDKELQKEIKKRKEV